MDFIFVEIDIDVAEMKIVNLKIDMFQSQEFDRHACTSFREKLMRLFLVDIDGSVELNIQIEQIILIGVVKR